MGFVFSVFKVGSVLLLGFMVMNCFTEFESNAQLLPIDEDCLSLIISSTSPRDACRLSLVSSTLRSVADSDAVWETFLPTDYKEIISGSSCGEALLSSSKKEQYLHLSFHTILIDNGIKSFQLEKESGKKCYMLGARALTIVWGDDLRYWTWKSMPESRFSQVAVLNHVWWFEVTGKIEIRSLSSRTYYAAYLVFNFIDDRESHVFDASDDEYGFEPFLNIIRRERIRRERYGFREKAIEMCVNVEGGASGEVRDVLLDPPSHVPQQVRVRERGDGWKEVEMGVFWNETGDDGTLECTLREVAGFYKEGLIIEGIELRPRDIVNQLQLENNNG